MSADTMVQVSEDGTEAWFERLPSEPTRLIWCDWLRRHSIDPNDVAVSGEIVRDPARRTVSYEGFQRDDQGEIVIDHARLEARRVQVVVQLEAPPMPFPEVTQ